ncbi:prevent-host-death protein [Halolactibacillus miurensis]|uniref:Antitoxin n=1 Tax=Halolactibacillus miurensis TaxID=306541 RepID=A0A1I6UIC4_9BACI|nr:MULTISPECIES: type II toxin-antitoxin system Phd/YefM family antitoxin [Halolactibacillus]GEM05292.1 prevent-host-death protein [Halolactibacillus miurensis]SFT01161.1 antitoxin Phd [Halolactibacillus miurensis]
MRINVENLVSISEANQNFSKVARMVDEKGTAIILKNNKPRYILMEYNQLDEDEKIGDQEINEVAENLISKHMKAFKELAK